eukprot:Ihof_evm2s755 gene=Ihof_evmTU2s755
MHGSTVRRPLLSVILAINSSRGQQLVFRYPDNQYVVGDANIPSASGPSHENTNQKAPLRSSGSKATLQTTTPKDLSATTKPKTLLPPRMVVHNTEKFGTLFGYTSEFLASVLTPEALLCDQPFQLTVDDLTFLGYPTLLARHPTTRSSTDEDQTIQLFHLVFVIQNVPHDDGVIPAYHRLIQQITAGLTHEELRYGFLGEQVNMILSWRDGYIHDPGSKETLTTCILGKSLLAQHMKEIYDALTVPKLPTVNRGYSIGPYDASVHIKLNNWVPINWNLNAQLESAYRSVTNGNGNQSNQTTSANDLLAAIPSTLRPYHTLLLLDDPTTLLNSMPSDCAPALPRLISICTPMKSFSELAMDTDIPLAFVYRLSAHLVYWQKAVIINKMSKNNTYIVSPTAVTDINSDEAVFFSRYFSPHSLAAALSKFSQPKQLSEHVDSLSPSQLKELINMVIWLLRHHMLIELHTFVYLLVPDAPPGDLQPEMTQDIQAKGLTPHEYHYVQSLPASENPHNFSLFLRLAPYFRGDHHVEEIMWRENISRSEIST